MLKTYNPELSGRHLPLRNRQYSIDYSVALALPYPIWYSNEVIIFDALRFLRYILSIYKHLRINSLTYAFRITSLIALFFLAIGHYNNTNVIVAQSFKQANDYPKPLAFTTHVTARKAHTIYWPVPKSYISSYFSPSHQGIDIPTAYGYPVKAYRQGKIVFANWDGGYGKIVIIQHEDGEISKYAHLSEISVIVGQNVNQNEVIGNIGATGYATGSHLHFEIRNGAGPINPLNLLPQ